MIGSTNAHTCTTAHGGNGKRTGNFAGIVSTHAIGNDVQVLFGVKRIFVLLSHHAYISGCAPFEFHERISNTVEPT